jgi:hypothetical protein
VHGSICATRGGRRDRTARARSPTATSASPRWSASAAAGGFTLTGAGDVGARLTELAARYGLPLRAEDRLAALLDSWRPSPQPITTVRDPAEGSSTRTWPDSLVGARAAGRARRPAGSRNLGSGGGFPGLALAIGLPGRPRRPGGERGAQVRVPGRGGRRAQVWSTWRWSTPVPRRGRAGSAAPRPRRRAGARAAAGPRGVRGASARAPAARSWPGRAAGSRERRPTAQPPRRRSA